MITRWLRARRRAATVVQLEEARRTVKIPPQGIVVWASRDDAIRNAPPRLVEHVASLARKSGQILYGLDRGIDVRDDVVRLHRHLEGLLAEIRRGRR